MSKKYSVDDILNELESKKSIINNSSSDYEEILNELLNKERKSNVELNNSFFSKDKTDEEAFEAKHEEEKTLSSDTIMFDSLEIKQKKNFEVKIDYDKHEKAAQPENNENLDKTLSFDFEKNLDEIEQESCRENTLINEDLKEFHESRKKKVETFVLFGEEEEDDEPENEVPKDEVVKTLEDFNDYSESTAIIKDLSGIKASLSLRFVVLLVLSIISAYIELGPKIGIPTLEIFDKNIQPISYLIVSALIFLAAILVSAPAIFGGFTSLFRLKADGDSLLSVSALGCAIQYLFLFISPMYIATARNSVYVYSLIAIIGMLFNTIGKLMIIKRVRLNFRFVSGGYEKCAIIIPETERLESYVKEEFDSSYATIAIPRKTDFIGGFLGYSYKEDGSDNLSKYLSPIILFGSVVLFVTSFIIVKDFQKAASVLAAVTSISCPISVMICINYPLLRTVKSLVSRGCMISGIAGCNEIYDTNSVLVKSADLFPKGSIQLSAIKTFAAGKIDDVILDAASVVVKAESDLSNVFLSVIEGKKELLKEVDSIVYEEAMGLSAWVNSKRVLIGNRDLISNHGIAVPSKDYEDRYLNTGMDVVYFAESGELVAAFLIQYKPSAQIKKAMKALQKLGIGVVISSTDPNIDDKKIGRIFDVDSEMIRTVPAEKYGETEKISKQTARETVGTACISTFTAFVQTIYAAIRLKGISALALTIQTLGGILGFAIMTFFTIISGSISISVEAILLYQIFWLVAVAIIPCFKKIKI